MKNYFSVDPARFSSRACMYATETEKCNVYESRATRTAAMST